MAATPDPRLLVATRRAAIRANAFRVPPLVTPELEAKLSLRMRALDLGGHNLVRVPAARTEIEGVSALAHRRSKPGQVAAILHRSGSSIADACPVFAHNHQHHQS